MNNLDKKFYTPLAELSPELQPNGRVVKCIKDMGNGYLVITTDDNINPNIWVIGLKNLREVKTEIYE